MIANLRLNAGGILAARFPFTLLERRPPKTPPPVPGSLPSTESPTPAVGAVRARDAGSAATAVSAASAFSTGAVPVSSVIPAPRSASPLDLLPPPMGRERYVLCDDCLGPAVIEARVPRDPEAHEVCETCAQAPYYDGAWLRPLVQSA
jgi:hypothetical protein